MEQTNQLKVHRLEEIITLKAQGWSARRTARGLNIDRETVGKYLRNGAAKPATPTLGSEEEITEREVDRTLAAARAGVQAAVEEVAELGAAATGKEPGGIPYFGGAEPGSRRLPRLFSLRTG